MPITKKETFDHVLIRMDETGEKVKGGQVGLITTIIDDDGSTISVQQNKIIPINSALEQGYPVEEVLDKITVAQQVTIEEQKKRIVLLETELRELGKLIKQLGIPVNATQGVTNVETHNVVNTEL